MVYTKITKVYPVGKSDPLPLPACSMKKEWLFYFLKNCWEKKNQKKDSIL